MKKKLLAVTLCGLAGMSSAFAASDVEREDLYYAGARVIGAFDRANNIDLTSPRSLSLEKSKKKRNHVNGAVSLGYQFSNGWRAEGEYTLSSKSRFSSYWYPFGANENRYEVKAQRFMLNGYRDYALNQYISLYASAGLGVASVKVDGWQGNPSRAFAKRTQQNLAYSVGVGATFNIDSRFAIDLGYRYVDLGKVESGYNTFSNAATRPNTPAFANVPGTGLRDEQLKLHLISHEIYLGARITF